LVYPSRTRRPQLQVIGLLVVVAACLAAVAVKTMITYGTI
jgi:hypothetical protein